MTVGQWIFILCQLLGIYGYRNGDRDKMSLNHRLEQTAVEEFHHYEVVKPQLFLGTERIYSTQIQNGHLGRVQLIIPNTYMQLIVDLELNRHLLGGSYVERVWTEQGEVTTTHQNSSQCFYHGVDVTAAISTCDGVSGYLNVGGEVFHLQSIDEGIDGRHHLYRDLHRKHTNLSCGHEDHHEPYGVDRRLKQNLHERLKRSVRWPYDKQKDTRIVELYLVNDKSQYDAQGGFLSKLIRRNKEIVNLVSSLYRPINTYIALVGIEVWTTEDKIEVLADADKTMNNFLEYRRQEISPKYKNDNAQLITGIKFQDGVVGKAPISTLCSWQYSGGVNMDHSTLVGPTATTVAHELGHNFGLIHDLDSCQCPDEKCIMASSSSNKNPTHWSSCSFDQFSDAFHQSMDLCLRDRPPKIYGGAVCMNGFLEEGEDCDCGLPEDCQNKCCNATTCKFTANSTCATGACCDLTTCLLREATFPCRPAAGGCDLPEACNGTSQFCPDDVFLQDGSDCHVGGEQSHCYNGKCHTKSSQCKLLWGETGKVSLHDCYSTFNLQGNSHGNCGYNPLSQTYIPCNQADVMCGMLHCDHKNEKLMLWKEALAYTMPEAWVFVNGTRYECKAAILDVGLHQEDPGMVPSGTKCGDGKMCLNHKCELISELPLPLCPDCHGNGVCNSLGQCHCDAGWGPPLCSSAGPGGSLHSGPIANYSDAALITGLCIFFLLVVPIVVILVILSYRHRDKVKEIWSQMTGAKYRFIQHARPVQAENASAAVTSGGAVRREASVAVRQPSKVSRPRPPVLQKQPSFTKHDIGQFQLQQTTNDQIPVIPELSPESRSKTLEQARARQHLHRGPSNPGSGAVPTRAAPAPPYTSVVEQKTAPPPRPLSPPGAAPIPNVQRPTGARNHASGVAKNFAAEIASRNNKPSLNTSSVTQNSTGSGSSSQSRPPQLSSVQSNPLPSAVSPGSPTGYVNVPRPHGDSDHAAYADIDHHYANDPPPRPPPPAVQRQPSFGLNKAPVTSPDKPVSGLQPPRPLPAAPTPAAQAVGGKPCVSRKDSAAQSSALKLSGLKNNSNTSESSSTKPNVSRSGNMTPAAASKSRLPSNASFSTRKDGDKKQVLFPENAEQSNRIGHLKSMFDNTSEESGATIPQTSTAGGSDKPAIPNKPVVRSKSTAASKPLPPANKPRINSNRHSTVQ